MPTVTTGFTLTGEFVTEHARDLMLEGDWEGAYRFLTEYVDGCDHDTAVAMLKGEKRIIGEAGPKGNTLELADEDPERKAEIEEDCNRLWAGTVRFRPIYLRPYAIVTNFGPRDIAAAAIYGNEKYDSAPEDAAALAGHTVKKVRWNFNRCCEYMNDPANDYVYIVKLPNGDSHFVLFERTESTPIWWSPIPCRENWQEKSVAQWVEAHGDLPERGYIQKFEDEPPTPEEISEEVDRRLSNAADDLADRVTGSDRDDFLKQQMADQVARLSPGLDPEAVAGTISHLFNGGEDEGPPVEDNPEDHKYGWILPDGSFYGCTFHGHADLAGRLFRYKLGMEEPPADSVKEAMEQRWVCVSKSAVTGEFRAQYTGRPNSKQWDVLKDWAAFHQIDFETLIDKGASEP